MTNLLRSVATAMALLWCANAYAQSTPPPVEAFGRLPAVVDAAISPDGSKVALAMSQEGGALVNVVDLTQRRSVYAEGFGDDLRLRAVGWADDDHVSFLISQTFHPSRVLPSNMRFRGAPRRVDYYRNGVINITGRFSRVLSVNEEEAWQDQGATLIAPIEGDPGYARMIGRAPGVETVRPAVYRVNMDSGRSRIERVNGEGPDTIGYLLDERGAVVARTDSDEETNRWRVFVYDGEQPRLLMEDVSATGDAIDFAGLMPDGRIAAFDEDDTGEFYRLYAIDRASGARELLFEREGFEVNGTVNDPWTRQVVGVEWIEQETEQKFFEPALQAAYEAVSAMFEGGSVRLSSWSRDRIRILVYGEQGLDGGGFYTFTPADNQLTRVSMLYPELAAAVVGGVRQSITYRSRDGARIPAYLTLPEVADPHNLPVVVLVHGGPHARDTLDFDWWASFLASRGYAVLQANFRGSGGYGASWRHAGDAQWGGLMQTDVEDGVTALVRTRIADPARICIVGASYGGYAALAGATLTPDLYKCAASIAGPSDLVEFLRDREATFGSESMTADHWRISIGDRREDRDRIQEVSPANLAARVKIPVLLIHGTDDTVVPIVQSRRMLDRLRDAGKDVRFVELRGDDHWLSDATTRIQMLRELETFLAGNLGPSAN